MTYVLFFQLRDQEMETKYTPPPMPKKKEQPVQSTWGGGNSWGDKKGQNSWGSKQPRGGGGRGRGGRGGGRGFKSTLNQGFTQFQSGGQLASYTGELNTGYGGGDHSATYNTGYYAEVRNRAFLYIFFD